MQGMLENLSQPVAFATAPLGDPEVQTPQSPGAKTEEKRRDRSLSSDTDSDEPIFSKFTRRIGLTRDVGKSTRSQSSQQSTQDEDDAFDSDFMADGMLFSMIVQTKLRRRFQAMICLVHSTSCRLVPSPRRPHLKERTLLSSRR